MIQDGDINRNVNTDDIILLLDEWDAEECMDAPSTFHMRKYYVINYKSYHTDIPNYIETISGENVGT